MNPATTPDPELARMYEEAARDYLHYLPLSHFMEATAQGTQREITLESFALVRVHRPDVQCFNELLVQYPRKKRKKNLGQVVPDNMVVIHPEPIRAAGSFNLSDQPAAPFLVLEYVSKHSKRKDYDDNFDKYETELRVPYYLLFYPDNQDLTVFRLAGGKYVSVTPNEHGRLAVPELELEAALLDGWVRFWFRGELLPLPGELLKQLNAAKREVEAERQARLTAEAEVARLREELARARGQQP
jgi:Uma2 family endonuclease